MLIKNPVYLVKDILKNVISKGDTVIDGTCGNGNDTLFLAECVGKKGKVYAFDIQKQAIQTTKKKLLDSNLKCVRLINDGHQEMDRYIKEDISCAMYNLGYLPGGDKSVATEWQNTIAALKKTMSLLRSGGIISVIIYHGKQTGYLEKEKVLEFLEKIDYKSYNVLKMDYHNRINNPPIPIIIEKL